MTTTIDSADQEAAYHAVRKGVMDYERRHGYRGPEGFVNLPANQDDRDEAIDDALADHPDNGDLIAGVVTSVNAKQVVVEFVNADPATITGDGLRFAAAGLRSNASAAVRIKPGSIVRVVQDAKGNWSITQLPQVEGALVSLVPQDGAIRALVGGFDYNKNKFNHVTQAWRQPGSSFKPFIYSASLEKGLGPATIINDAPLYFPPTTPGGDAWEPKDDDQPDGPDVHAHGLAEVEEPGVDPHPFVTSARSTRRITSRRSSVSMSTKPRRICRSRSAPVSSRRCNWPAVIRCSPTAARGSIRT